MAGWKSKEEFLITQTEQQGSRFVRVHYLLANGMRTAVSIDSASYSVDEAERIGRALVSGGILTGRDVRREA